MTYFEECVIDFDDPSSNKISTLKKEAANQGIEIPKNARKIDIINLIKEKRNSSLNSTAARNDQEYESIQDAGNTNRVFPASFFF